MNGCILESIIFQEDVHGFLINSTRLIAGQFPDITLPPFQRMVTFTKMYQ